jgi:hypothetical protein
LPRQRHLPESWLAENLVELPSALL